MTTMDSSAFASFPMHAVRRRRCRAEQMHNCTLNASFERINIFLKKILLRVHSSVSSHSNLSFSARSSGGAGEGGSQSTTEMNFYCFVLNSTAKLNHNWIEYNKIIWCERAGERRRNYHERYRNGDKLFYAFLVIIQVVFPVLSVNDDVSVCHSKKCNALKM